MAAMNIVCAGGFSGVSFQLRICPQEVAPLYFARKTPIFGSRRSKLDQLTVAYGSAAPEDTQL